MRCAGQRRFCYQWRADRTFAMSQESCSWRKDIKMASERFHKWVFRGPLEPGKKNWLPVLPYNSTDLSLRTLGSWLSRPCPARPWGPGAWPHWMWPWWISILDQHGGGHLQGGPRTPFGWTNCPLCWGLRTDVGTKIPRASRCAAHDRHFLTSAMSRATFAPRWAGSKGGMIV